MVADRLTGAQIIVEYLVRQGVRYAAGIPGHGCWTLTDALLDRSDEITTVQVMHEQSAVHLADGYYRASGEPMLAFTSIGPGATNTVIGMATAYVDSTAVALFTGSPHTYMRGHGMLQELERRHVADNPRLFEPVVKEWWQPSRVDELPFVLHRAWNAMRTGRPGPVLLDIPMDVQAEAAEVTLPDPEQREATGRLRPDADAVERAARLLADAKRPVIVAGGGVISAEATAELRALAERLGAPVVTTWNGKGAIDETHPLAGQTIGDTGSTIGNTLASTADVLLSVGNRFVDWSASSWRKGVTFAIPPTKLIQLEIDAREIGKNYPVAVPLLGDARAGLRDLLDALGQGQPDTAYGDEIAELRARWEEQIEIKSGSDAQPMTMARAVREIQAGTRPDAIVVTGAGLPQGMVKQRWVTREPRTHITSGGFSTMGFTLPAALGAQLAKPDAQVLALCGDGDFLQTMQELSAAAILGSRVCTVVLDNSGWISIKGGQKAHFGRTAMTDFTRNGKPYSPDFAAIGRAFDIHTEYAATPAEVKPAIERALASGGPSLVHIPVERDLDTAGPDKTGWWDVPVPEGRPVYDEQLKGRAEEQHRVSLRDAPIGCVPILWNNVDLPDLGPEVPFREILDELRVLGFAGCQFGRGFPEGAALAAELASRDLRLAELYSALPATAQGLGDGAAELAARGLDRLVAAGGEVLVVALDGSPDRDAISGRAIDGPRWPDAAFDDLARLLDDLARRAPEGTRVTFHPHTATWIEAPDEVTSLASRLEATAASLCLDVGHYTVGGGDPVEAIRRYGDLVTHVHAKDVDGDVLRRLRAGELDGFGGAVRERLFTELGNGVLDLPGVLGALDEIGFDGWLMAEQDSSGLSPAAAAAVNGRVLRYAIAEQDR